MRKAIEITGTVPGDMDTDSIKILLEAAGVSTVKIETRPQFDDWHENLSKEAVPGLSDACIEWIR